MVAPGDWGLVTPPPLSSSSPADQSMRRVWSGGGGPREPAPHREQSTNLLHLSKQFLGGKEAECSVSDPVNMADTVIIYTEVVDLLSSVAWPSLGDWLCISSTV